MPRTALPLAPFSPAATPAAHTPAMLRLALAAGDERLAVEPSSGRNRYGVPPAPAPEELWFASSTASAISPRGHAAAAAALGQVLDRTGMSPAGWSAAIRERLDRLFGIPGSVTVLTGSGTEAELVVLAFARALLGRPLTNIVVAPGETGSGVVLAAGGRHFLATATLDPMVERGAALAGFAPGEVAVESVAIRAACGAALDPEAVDAAVTAGAERAVSAGRDVLVHALDCSKTGLAGLSRAAAAALLGNLGGRALVVVDACQLRCSAEAIRRDLAMGFLVMITGSKFAAGPPFSGAVLVPPALAARLGAAVLPDGLRAYCALHDWPEALRGSLARATGTEMNLALCLRWEAALAELEPLLAIEAASRARIARRFAECVEERVAGEEGLSLLPDEARTGRSSPRTIFPVFTAGPDGVPLDADVLHRALRAPGRSGPVVHVGQPVAVGPRAALRVCLAAPEVTDAAARLAAGASLDAAMAPLEAALGVVFAKWRTVRAALAAGRPAA